MDTILGTYDKTLKRNEKNGYTVFSIRSKGFFSYRTRYGTLVCQGFIPEYAQDIPIRLVGTWVEQTDHQWLFQVDSIEETFSQKEMMFQYLVSTKFIGIGEKIAEKIVNLYGEKLYELVFQENFIQELKQQIPEISIDHASQLIGEIQKTRTQRIIFQSLLKYGGTYIHAKKLWNLYGNHGIEKLNQYPHQVGEEIGLSFSICDYISYQNQLPYYTEERIQAIIHEVLKQNESEGNTYIELDDLFQQIDRFTNHTLYKKKFTKFQVKRELIQSSHLILEYDEEIIKVFQKSTWFAEKNIAFHLHRLVNSGMEHPFQTEMIQPKGKHAIQYNEQQQDGISALKTSGIKIITGGPGTGKSTIIKRIIELYKQMYPDDEILLCAPTGRAAQRMKEVTGYTAVTVHRGIEYQPFDSFVQYKGMDDPITASLVIVDEMSMMDTNLFSLLLGAIQNGSTVILTGDENQLASVQAGNILYDLIHSEELETHRLTEIYRQANDSSIITNCLKIEQGDASLVTDENFEIIQTKSEYETKMKIEEYMLKYYQKKNPFYTQILTPIKKTMAGTYALNTSMQELLNKGDICIEYGRKKLKRNDKMIMTRNNYDKNYFNGDIGTVIDQLDSELTVSIQKKLFTLRHDELEDLELAYAITIHKSQGSEFPITIIALTDQCPNMLTRRILFTAISRAKEKVILITQRNALQIAVSNQYERPRQTNLIRRIQGIKPQIISRET